MTFISALIFSLLIHLCLFKQLAPAMIPLASRETQAQNHPSWHFKVQIKTVQKRQNNTPILALSRPIPEHHDQVERKSSALSKSQKIQSQSHPGVSHVLTQVWRDWFARNLPYPARARALGEDGPVKIKLELGPKGELLTWQLVEPSRFFRLNDQVEKTLNGDAVAFIPELKDISPISKTILILDLNFVR